MKVSFLIPTRRTKWQQKLIENIYKQTSDKKNIEILFAVDEDDGSSIQNLNGLKGKFWNNIKIYKRPRTKFINNDYYNWLAEKATGELLWVYADDLLLTEPNWDIKILPLIDKFLSEPKRKDRVACMSIRDNTPPPSHRLPKFPCFPMFTKEALKALGWLFYPDIPNWGADYVTYQTYNPVGRLLEIMDRNYINHVSYHTKQVPMDEVSKRLGSIFNALKMVPKHNTDRILSETVPRFRRKLNAYIEQHGGEPKYGG